VVSKSEYAMRVKSGSRAAAEKAPRPRHRRSLSGQLLAGFATPLNQAANRQQSKQDTFG
jgi:hypothetical protein